MPSWERNVEAYHIVADMLVNLRRIMHRGLEKCAGKTWYLDGCPPGIYERLVARKEHEAAIDRFSRDYEQIINFATFDELADVLEFNSELEVLLASLQPDGTTLVERLREMEIVRLKLAEGRAFSDDDIEILSEYHREFRQLLAKPRSRPSEETLPSTGEESPVPSVETAPPPSSLRDAVAAAAMAGAEDTNTDITGAGDQLPEQGADAVPAEPVGQVLPPVTAEIIPIADEVEEEPLSVEIEPPEPVEEEPDELDTPLPLQEEPAVPPDEGGSPENPVVEAELAMANDDDAGVLRALHREVMWVAEGVFELDSNRPHAVWETLRAGGWYDRKLGELALAPLEFFYSVAEEVRDKVRAGVEPEEIKEFLAEAHFSALLLSLREMFLKQAL